MIVSERDFLNFMKLPPDWELTKEGYPIVKGLRLRSNPELVEFHEAHRVHKNLRKNKIVSFFLPDYLFERCWSRLTQTTTFVSLFKGALSPDFSQYTDMPDIMRRWNHYRKMFVHKYWESSGIKVIPTICWSDENSFEYCLKGVPKHSLVAVSSVGVHRSERAKDLFKYGYERMLDELEPSQVLFYGKPFDYIEATWYIGHARNERFNKIRSEKTLEQEAKSVPTFKETIMKELMG